RARESGRRDSAAGVDAVIAVAGVDQNPVHLRAREINVLKTDGDTDERILVVDLDIIVAGGSVDLEYAGSAEGREGRRDSAFAREFRERKIAGFGIAGASGDDPAVPRHGYSEAIVSRVVDSISEIDKGAAIIREAGVGRSIPIVSLDD